MKWSPLYLAALTPLAFLGSSALFGQAIVLTVTLAIFFGTLSLGRSPSRTASRTDPPLNS